MIGQLAWVRQDRVCDEQQSALTNQKCAELATFFDEAREYRATLGYEKKESPLGANRDTIPREFSSWRVP